jgi:hypothetical protein
MIERHPAGRSCALALLAVAGVLTASGLAIGHAIATQNDPAQPATAPVAVVQTLAPTTTPAITTTPAATTTAPVAAPRAVVAEPTATEETTVTNPPAGPTVDDTGRRLPPPPSAGAPAEPGVDYNDGSQVGPVTPDPGN